MDEIKPRPKRVKMMSCIVNGCKGKDSDEISLFKIPPHDKKAWCLNLQRNPSEVKGNMRVCSRHFESKWRGLGRLKSGARPTLQLGELKANALSYDACKPRFNPRKCCLVGCTTTSPPHTLHKFPKDTERLQEWLSICPIKTTALNNKYKYICVNHFKPSDIEEFRLRKNAKPMASLCFSMQDDVTTPTRTKYCDKDLNELIPPEKSFYASSDEDYVCDTDSSTEDGVECRNCDACFKDYFSKFKEIERQRKEAEARHLIETLALQNQIEELTAELQKIKSY